MSANVDKYEEALKFAQQDDGDFGKVFTLLFQSYEDGDSRAAYALGTWYLHGKHVRKNLKKALHFLREAADESVKEACYDLALCYEQGVGVRKSEKRAVQYYVKAALAGDDQSIYEVGRCYYYGLGVKRDRGIAEVWLSAAEQKGIAD